jgi:hypothetical protein
MTYKITNWENDMIAEPEEKVVEFVKEKYPHYELGILSGLGERDLKDIYDSLKESRVIIMQPSLLVSSQIREVVSYLSHPIHINFNSATRNLDIRDFIFLSSNPWHDLNFVKSACAGVKDSVNEPALRKIVKNCEVHFYGFAGEHYEMINDSFGDIKALRHK